MWKSVLLMLLTLLGWSLPVYAQDVFARARLRVTLHQCISADSACTRACVYGVVLPPPSGGLSDLEYKQCRNKCDANHAACVDLAFSSMAPARTAPAPAGGAAPKRAPAKSSTATKAK